MSELGRPSDYTPELAAEICAQLAEGMSLRSVCADMDMPDKSTIFRWLSRSNDKEWAKDFRDQYARAKEEAADALAEEILEIADEAPRKILGMDRSDNARIQAQKIRIDTRRWLMAKMKPKRYGDKLDLTSKGDKLEQPPLVISQIAARGTDAGTEAEAKASS